MRISVKDIKLKLDIKQFIIPHQSFIVNPRYIMLIKNFEIKMSDGDIIPISQLQKSAVVEAFKKYTLGE